MKLIKTLPFSLLVVVTLCSCSTNNVTIKAKTFKTAIEFHTEDQIEYFDNVFYGDKVDTLDAKFSGLTEQSQPKPITLSWTSETEAKDGYNVYISEKADMEDPLVYETSGKTLDVYNLKVNTSYYYQVKEINGNAVSDVASFKTEKGIRNLYLEGVTNARDIGGYYVGENNKTIKQGLLFRGGRLNNSYPLGFGAYGTDYSQKDLTAAKYERELTDKGVEEMVRLGIKNEIDLRADNGNGYPGSKTDEYIVINVPGSYYNAFPMTKTDPLYNSSNKASVKGVFEFMADEDNYPIYFHCNIGTNRTGTIAMLAEALCGVSENQLLQDYMFSNFGTICIAERQYDRKQEVRAELKDVTDTNETFYRLINAAGDTMSEKAITVLGQVGVSRQTALAVKNILLGE